MVNEKYNTGDTTKSATHFNTEKWRKEAAEICDKKITKGEILSLVNAQERPDLYEAIRDYMDQFTSTTGEVHDQLGYTKFLQESPGTVKYWLSMFDSALHSQFALLRKGSDSQETIVAVGNCAPIYWSGNIEELPSGWDAALEASLNTETPKNTLCAFNAYVGSLHQNKGYSKYVLLGMKAIAKAFGFSNFIVPLRPILKRKYPLISIERYLNWKTDIGAPFDPWIRRHVQMGAKVLKAAPQSQFCSGTIQEWEEWTDMKFPESGDYVVHGALDVVKCDVENDVISCWEPNVWVQHPL